MLVVRIINKQTSQSPQIMHLAHVFVFKCLKPSMLIMARHVPGLDNDISDSLFHFQEKHFWTLAPEAARDPDPMHQ